MFICFFETRIKCFQKLYREERGYEDPGPNRGRHVRETTHTLFGPNRVREGHSNERGTRTGEVDRSETNTGTQETETRTLGPPKEEGRVEPRKRGPKKG